MSERILITGANGLVGQQLQHQLATTTDHAVIATDLQSPQQAHAGSNTTFESLDVIDGERIDQLFAEHRPTVVVHLASIVTPGADSTRAQAYRVDVDGSSNIIQACVNHRCKRLVVTSSGAAYGYHADNPCPLSEHHALRGNEAFAYAAHKREVENLLARARTEHPALEQVVLRVGTVLGERVDNQITALFRKKRLLAVRGSDSPFVFIWDEDLARILARAISVGPSGVFNVCGDGWLSIDQIAALLDKSTVALPAALLRAALSLGSRLRISRYGPEQVVFLQYRPVLSNEKLKREFGYRPRLTSEQAFERWARCAGLCA